VYSTATTTALALDLATVNAGSPVQATVTVTRGALGPAMSGEVEVSSTDGDATCRAAVNAAGNAVCTLYFSAPGAKSVKADYLENDDYAGSASGQVAVTVNPVVIEPIVGAGDQFTCSIDSNGHLFCWGTNDSGQSTPPNWGVYDQLDLGMSHACAVGLNRQVKCWGWNGPNNLISPPLVYGAVRVTTGNSHSCLLTDYGYARCWGDASSSSARLQVPYPFNYDYAKIDAGADHTCAITKSGAIRCWGLNTRGQISTAPTTGTYTDISAGGDLSCALNAAGTPSCWGSLATAPAGPFASLSAGKDFACGLKSDGGVTCWGSRNDTLTGPFSQISAGADHVCGLLQSGRMQCWGGDAKGQAPVIAITPASLPTIDVGETLPAQSTPLALNASGGRINQYAYSISTGSLPAGLNLNSSDGKISGTPTQSGVFNFTVRAQEANLDPAIVAEKSYMLTVRGRVDAAVDSAQPSGAMVGRTIEVHFSVHARPGYTMSGEPTGVVTVTAEDNQCEVSLTNGTGSCLMVFVTPGAKTITIDYPGDSLYLPGQPASAFTYTVTAFSQPPQILTGLDRTIVHKADGTVGCIGGVCALDQLGGVFTRVGIGDDFACGLQYHEFPQDNVIRGEVVCAVDDAADALNFSNSPYIDLAVGNHHACALKIDGTVECQGDNTSGQAAPPAGVYTSLSAGGGHTCALNGSGEAACWGAIAAPPAGPFTHLTSGDAHTCGLKHDGSVICWGDNSAGQSTVPVAPAAFAQIAAGGNQTCGLDAEGHAACWGDNAAGQAEPAYGHFIAVDTDADHTCALRAGLGFTCWGNDGLSAPGAPQFTIAQLTETEIPALTAFVHDFDVTGGSEPLNAGVFAGRLPDGMCVGAKCGPGTNVEPQPGFTPQDLSPAGLRLSGTPTLPGEYEFAIRWSDASPYPLVMEQPYWLTVTGGDLAVTLAPVLSPS
ncbi:MAG TPA: Ig-like domain repeat protein, partial [Anaerolineaceae bacterium]|nr:Ig-like domain repeat protein [Anaerolineaceae bacterium]